MNSENPFASPGTEQIPEEFVEDVKSEIKNAPLTVQEAYRIRQEHLLTEGQIANLGLAVRYIGICNIFISITFIPYGAMLIYFAAFIFFCFGIAGNLIEKLQQAGRSILYILVAIVLPSLTIFSWTLDAFPGITTPFFFGICLIILIKLSTPKANMVFSEDYQTIIELTPNLQIDRKAARQSLFQFFGNKEQ